MASGSHATYYPCVQEFRTWLDEYLKTGSQDDSDDSKEFVPSSEIKKQLRPRGFLKEMLSGFCQGDLSAEASDIIKRYSTVFAILVFIGQPHHILHFLHYDSLCDTKLPFGPHTLHFPKSEDDRGPNSLLRRFRDAQPPFCAKTLNERSKPTFDYEDRLPFLDKIYLNSGGSARVYKIRIHSDYDNLQPRGGSVRHP